MHAAFNTTEDPIGRGSRVLTIPDWPSMTRSFEKPFVVSTAIMLPSGSITSSGWIVPDD
jgi:hypothetical protein